MNVCAHLIRGTCIRTRLWTTTCVWWSRLATASSCVARPDSISTIRLVAPEDAAAQAAQAMQNVTQLLEEAGSSLEHVCKVTTYITDRAYRVPVYNTVGRYLKGIPTVATGLIVKGLAMPEMKMEIDVDAVIPQAGAHQRLRVFNTRDWFNQSAIDRDSCMVIRPTMRSICADKPVPSSMAVAWSDSDGPRRMQRPRPTRRCRTPDVLLDEAGSSLEEVCKLRVYIGDRAYREPVYQVLGRHFGDVHPCSTGLIMRGFARPDILCEIDMAVALAHGTPHQRLRTSRPASSTKTARILRCKFCDGRTRWRSCLSARPDRQYVGRRVRRLMAMLPPRQPRPCRTSRPCSRKPDANLDDICKITIYIADRAYREPVYQVVGQALKGVFPVGTGLIVDGFASPRILVEIDVDAVVQVGPQRRR